MAETDDRLSELRQRWEADPSSRVFLQLAEEYRRHGKIDEAVEVLEKGLEYAPNHLSAQVALGRCRLEQDDFEGASRLLEQVIDKDPTQLVANKLLVEAYLGKGDLSRAEERLDLYTLLNDGDPAIETLRNRLDKEKEVGSEPEEDSPFLLPVEPVRTPELAPVATDAEVLGSSEARPPVLTPEPLDDPFPEISSGPDLGRYLHRLGDEGLFPIPAPTAPVSSDAQESGVSTSPASAEEAREEEADTAHRLLPDSNEPVFAIDEQVTESADVREGDVFDLSPLETSGPAILEEDSSSHTTEPSLESEEAQESTILQEGTGLEKGTVLQEVTDLEGGEVGSVEVEELPTSARASDGEDPLLLERQQAEAAQAEKKPISQDLREESAIAPTLPEAGRRGESDGDSEPLEEHSEPEGLDPIEMEAASEPEATPLQPESSESELPAPGDQTPNEPIQLEEQPATVTLGKLYLDQGHTAEAKEIFEAVLSREPDNENAKAALANLMPDPPVWRLTAQELLDTPAGRGATGFSEKKAELLKSYLRRLRRQA
ncbi:MAG: tetratricopeptide repeat protein [Deltaproteobacteria bacterium]|nr:tetratricopeptide repeat protein [Deltaproteobacteria bacterium]